MKWLLKKIGRILSTALVLVLVISLLPYAQQLLGKLFPRFREDAETAVIRLSHEMAEVGRLTTVQYTDESILESVTNALLIGSVQRVRIPYRYEIGLGVDLSQIALRAEEDGSITAAVPPVEMMYDELTVTGEVQVEDFWYPLTESRYQQLLDEQEAACRAEYLNDPAVLDAAWQSTTAALYSAFVEWLPDTEDFQFEKAAE